MVDIYLDPTTNDVALVNNRIVLTTTIQDEVKQKVFITLNINKGSWAFNIDLGIPYFKNDNNPVQILGKTNKGIVDAYIQSALLDITGVVSLLSYTSEWNKRTGEYDIEFELDIESGDVVSGTTSLNLT